MLAAWPGEWSQDVFVIDDLPAARLAVGLSRRQATPRAEAAREAPTGPIQPLDRESYVEPGKLWLHLAELPDLRPEGQRQIAQRFADSGPTEVAVALLRRQHLDADARSYVLENTLSWRAPDLINEANCTTSEAVALLKQFPTSASVVEAALRPDTRDAAQQVVAELSYLEAAKLWLESRVWSPTPRQRFELAEAVLQVVLTKPVELPNFTGYGSERYQRPELIRSLIEDLSPGRRQELLADPDHGRLVQQALVADTEVTDEDLVACLPEVLDLSVPVSEAAEPPLLQYLHRFPRLIDLAGPAVRDAVYRLARSSWSPEQAARSGQRDAIIAAARLASNPEVAGVLVRAAVIDRSPAPGREAAWRDPRRYELVDLLVGNPAVNEDQLHYLVDRLTVEHLEELERSALEGSALRRLCAQALHDRRPAQPPAWQPPRRRPAPELPTDEQLSAMPDPRTVLRDLLRDRGEHRDLAVGHALDSMHMTDELAWRLPVKDLERHPVYGPKLAAKVAEMCGNSTVRWQEFTRSWA
ncbi:MAG: hypothetical protein ACJ73S_26520 [Mycobacteriales bacterium]